MHAVFYICLIAFAGGFVQGMTGFGVVLVALPLMAFFINIKTAVSLILLLGLVINAMLLLELIRHIEGRKWLPMFLCSLPGIPAGIYMLTHFTPSTLEIFVGAVVVVTAVFKLLNPSLIRETKQVWSYAAGFAAGVLGGSIGAAGPPVIVYVSSQPWTKEQIKSTMAVFFILEGFLIVLFHIFKGFITKEVMLLFGYTFFPLVLGVITGISAFNKVNDTLYRRIVHLFLLALGIMLLVKQG